MGAVRCVGNHNSAKHPAFPRMHHKFLVLCTVLPAPRDVDVSTRLDYPKIAPHAVWTGSFNFTHNATYSLENAVVLTDPQVVSAYMAEYEHILGLSELLDWDTPWITHNSRIGT